MVMNFRVSELQTLLGFAGRNRSGRKTELQARAIDLIASKSIAVEFKIRELFKSIQLEYQTTGVLLNGERVDSSSSNSQLNYENENMIPSTTGAGLWQLGYNMRSRNNPGNGTPGAVSDIQNAALSNVNAQGGQNLQVAQQQRTAVYPIPNYGQQDMRNNRHHLNQQEQRQLSYNPMYSRYPTSVATATNQIYPVHPDVIFKRLPFFEHHADLIKPSSLVPTTSQRIQEAIYVFHLTPGQATKVAENRDLRPGAKIDYVYQIQLRFCLLETSCEQEDFFPPSIAVKVNGKVCPLPNPIPTNKQGVEPKRPPKPVNITHLCKLSPTVSNAVTVTWAADYGKAYTMRVALVRKLTAAQLLQRLKNKGVKHADHTTGLIKEKLKADADDEIATTSLRVSLICPLGKFRMRVPCRASTCNHLQCFDASVYLEMNERRATWTCPVCDKPALFDNLVIDGYFQDVLDSPQLPPSKTDIELHKDGSWQISAKKETEAAVVSRDDSVEILSDEIEVIPISSTTNNSSSAAAAATNGTSTTTSVNSSKSESRDESCNTTTAPTKPMVVDLTLSDSDDDDLPLKRKASPLKPDSTKRRIEVDGVTSTSGWSSNNAAEGNNSVSSSGYQSPPIINLDSPSPPH